MFVHVCVCMCVGISVLLSKSTSVYRVGHQGLLIQTHFEPYVNNDKATNINIPLNGLQVILSVLHSTRCFIYRSLLYSSNHFRKKALLLMSSFIDEKIEVSRG